jgi:membrane-bound inhibitor of C-type lysozyme
MLGAALAVGLGAAGPVRADPASPAGVQPPMNDFNQAFYRCDAGVAFMISYDSEQPATAELTTNTDARHYALKRTAAASGVAFAGGGAKFWTNGKTVSMEGAKAAFQNCKMKGK